MFKQTAILLTALAFFASVHPAVAQQAAEKAWRIGYTTASPYIWPTFREGLRELGYVERKNLAIEFRQRKRPKTYLALAKELVQLKVDIILTVGGSATLAAKQATNTIPIVMGNSSSNPVSRGLIDSLARPGGNITGVIDILPNLAGKRMELLREIFPKLSRIAHLSPDTGSVGPEHLKAVEAAARALGMRVQALKVKGPDDLERAFRAAAEEGAEALIVVGVSFFIPHRPRIVNLEAKYRLPTMHTHTRWVQLGGLISYTTDVNVRYRRAAQYVDKVLKGANPADLPVEQPTKFNLEINLNTAKKLGITIPPSILLRATKVIE
jgi:putative ABC transport system substrate-binding protein